MSKFSPQPVVDAKFIVNNNQIIVIEFRDNLVVYTDVNGKIHGPINSDKWNSLKAKIFNEKHINKISNDSNEADLNSSLTSIEQSKTTSFVFEYNDETGIFTINKDGKPIIEPWVIKGENGENGLSAFDEWSKDNPGNFNDFINSLKGTNGKNGQNGASAFDLWLAQQNPEHPGNIDDYFDSLKGKDGENGKNGASAYEVWKAQGNPGNEKAFIDFLKGTNGKNGDNGASAYDLWFEKNKQGDPDDFLASLKGADGKDGLDGISAYQIWLNEGHKGDEEDFLKWIQDARKGEKGDPGDIFRPHYDERGYLYFRTKDGEKTNPERVKGDEGQIGPRGKEGKSAYQIWLDKGHIGTQQEFLDSLKGKDGFVPPPPKYGYKDVKDFQLPGIKVNPRLISSSEDLTDTRTPEQILDERIEVIKNIREQGNAKRCDWFKEFTWWCAGADKEVLRMCPADHTKNTGIGTVILFTALMAAFSGFIAIERVFDILWLQILFAILWGSMIFFLDRFITNTMYSDGEVKISRQEFINGLPRIIIAIFLGIVISAPLELQIFQFDVQKKIAENNVAKSQDFISSHKDYQILESSLSSINNELTNVKTMYDSLIAKKESEMPKTFEASTYTKPMRDEFGNEKIQILGGGSTILKSPKTIEEERNRIKEDRNSRIQALQSEKIKTQAALDSLKILYQNQYQNQKSGLLTELDALHEIAIKNYTPWTWASSFWDTVFHTWWYYLLMNPIGLIMLLLILIDVSPVFYKMMLADGLYDNYLYQEKTLDQYKNRLNLLKTYEKVDESELKKIAPFIFGKEYKDFVESLKEYNNSILSEKTPDYTDVEIQKKNQKLFDEVLDMKRRIILATYRRWYKTQHDTIIGDPADDENAGKDPFEPADIQDGPNGGASFSEN